MEPLNPVGPTPIWDGFFARVTDHQGELSAYDFSGNANETDMLMRNTGTGQFELYDISNNAITAAFSLGAVGLEWQVAGVGPLNGPGSSDMVLRNVNTGAFEVYDISNNVITAAAGLGAVGLDFQVGGIAADRLTTASMGSSSQVAQLVQAMAGFGWRQRRSRELADCPLRCRHLTAAVSDDAAALITLWERFVRRLLWCDRDSPRYSSEGSCMVGRQVGISQIVLIPERVKESSSAVLVVSTIMWASI